MNILWVEKITYEHLISCALSMMSRDDIVVMFTVGVMTSM